MCLVNSQLASHVAFLMPPAMSGRHYADFRRLDSRTGLATSKPPEAIQHASFVDDSHLLAKLLEWESVADDCEERFSKTIEDEAKRLDEKVWRRFAPPS